MKKTTIIIADDHPLFREGVKTVLSEYANLEVTAEAGNGEKALQLIVDLQPDVAILDFELPGLNGLEITNQLRVLKSKTQVIILTLYRDKKIFFKALDSGVMGYVLKDDAVLDIVNAVEATITGKHFFSASLNEMLVEKAINICADDKIIKLINECTATERKILNLVAEFKSNAEIADLLCISKRTVENHKVNIKDKLQLDNARDLLKFVLCNKEYL